MVLVTVPEPAPLNYVMINRIDTNLGVGVEAPLCGYEPSPGSYVVSFSVSSSTPPFSSGSNSVLRRRDTIS